MTDNKRIRKLIWWLWESTCRLSYRLRRVLDELYGHDEYFFEYFDELDKKGLK